MEMMITMMAMLLCVKVSVLMTTNAAASLQIHQMQTSHHELGYHHQQFVSSQLMITRKLMLQKRVEGYGDQDLVFYSDQKGALSVSDEVQKRGEETMVNGAKGSDPTRLTTMDYSHVRRRRPIHNNYFPKPINSP
ncbi:hypothetical protein L6452_13533 [Arctium lappa]|uniref:Uncharacterized protein n=1 Tax=Arctium lappa TaxID=4217 RepID=A0ACB9CIF5_ARCLA|nr:hypothetical protein L6452_13533 [Arctium lappa]